MWDKLRKQIEVERQQLQLLIDTYRPLLAKCGTTAPDAIECSALAAILHSFYNGVENIFKRVAIEIGGALPSGATWHVDLLESMTAATAARTGVISPSLRDRLREYLNALFDEIVRGGKEYRQSLRPPARRQNVRR